MNKIYDQDGALRRMGNDRDLFEEMVGLLKSDAPPLLMAAQSAYGEGDMSRLHRAAHTLKGLSANFGAQRAVAAADSVERLARKGQAEGMPAAITELDEAFDELIGALGPARDTSKSATS
jgi:two-component system, sensor histidine kinase and response regulator